METNPNNYAYPIALADSPYWQPDMTLRDYFAGQALAGNLGNPWATDAESTAKRRYEIADAMLAARESTQ